MAKSPESKTAASPVKAEILSITIDGKITACLGGTPVKLPNWEPGIELKDGPYFQRPGVFAIESSNNRDKLKVKVKVTGLDKDTTATLTGTPGNPDIEEITFEGTIKGRTESPFIQVIEVIPGEEPAYFKRIHGNMKWHLSFKNTDERKESIELVETPMEIFWIYGYPGKMYKKGVWIEVLRLLEVECGGLTEKSSLIRRVINYCHSGAGVRYDCFHYSSYYGLVESGGAFDLKAYLGKVHPLCNCFDQAGGLQTLLGALGIEVEWIVMTPFGYLFETNLVGRGRCNNPGFLSTLRSSSPVMLPEILPGNDPMRNAFSLHAFCIWKNQGYDLVLDACAGPRFSYDIKKTFVDGNKQSYINVSIDGLTNLYGNDPDDDLEKPGTIENIERSSRGVTDVHGISPSPFDNLPPGLSPREQKKIREFKKSIGFHEAGKHIPPDEGVACDWPDPFERLGLRDVPWARKFENTRNGIDVSLKEWCFIGANEYIGVQVYVSKTIEAARNRLTVLALSSTMPKVPFMPKPRPLGHLHLHWYSPYFMIEKWWFYNVCIKITALNPSIHLDELANELHELAKKNVVTNLPDWCPVIEKVMVTSSAEKPVPGKIKVGEEVIIEVYPAPDKDRSPPDSLMLDFFFVEGKGVGGEYLRLVEESAVTRETNTDKTGKFELRFEGRSPGITNIQLVLVNRNTLLCSDPYGTAVNVVK